MVFQRFNLFAHMTVLENVVEGPVTVLRRPREEATRKARELLGASASPIGRTTTRASCRAASSSASRSRARWPCSRS
jgi:ABC-type histidine transport system ATPase subunit